MAKKTILVNGVEIRLLPKDDDYICITDIAKSGGGDPSDIIKAYLRNRNNIQFLGLWEQLHNEDFNLVEFDQIWDRTGLNNFTLSVKEWISKTGANGIQARAGRYGGTYAQRDIALHFCTYFNSAFYLYLIKEFDRLKAEEAKQLNTEWDIKRIMSKANHRVHTEAIRQHLIPERLQYSKVEGKYFASEVDLINLALFGQTARQWRQANPDKNGNMRDYATSEQLLVLSNLQSLNASLLAWDCDQAQRFDILNKTAIEQMEILLNNPALKALEAKSNQPKKLE